MRKTFKMVIVFMLCFMMCCPAVGNAAELNPWYIDYTTEYGTKFTRDWDFGLSTDLPPVYNTDMKSNFFTYREEIPDEIPVWAPYTDEEIAESDNKLYVAPNGDDVNPGTIDKPFKTLDRALELAKNHKKGGLTIYLREGTYSNINGCTMDVNISGTEAHPTFISAYPGEDVVLTSAISIKGSNLKIADDEEANRKLDEKVKGRVYSVDLKALGYSNFGTFSTTVRPTLYVDGTQYTIARWPNGENTGMVKYTGKDGEYGVVDSGDVTAVAGKTGEYRVKGNGFEFVMSSSRPLTWENTGNIWMYGYWYEEWDKRHIQVNYFNEKKNSVRTVQCSPYGALHQSANSYYFYNILEELDSPGEWYINNKTGMLYIYPSAPIDKSNIMFANFTSDGIALNNSQNVVVNDIKIDTAGRYGIYTKNTRKIIFQNCEVKNAASNGVYIYGYNMGLLNCDIEGNCYVTSITGQQDDGTAGYATWEPTNNFVQNCIVQGTLQTSWGMRNIVSHNLITGSPTHCLYAHREFEAIFEYNEIVAGPNVNLDAGLIYVGCTAIHRGNHFRYNYLNRATPKIRNGEAYGIYFDDTSSYNYAYGNILREAGMFFHGGSNNVSYNNIFVDKKNNLSYAATNSNNYKLTAERWAGLVISDNDTRWSRQKRSTYQGHWMNRYVNDYDLHHNLLLHKHDYESSGYNIETDDLGKYIAKPKDCYYANNLFVNSPGGYNRAIDEERAVYENNVVLDYIPDFENYEDGLYDLTEEEIKGINPDMEVLPTQHKMGLIYDPIFKREKHILMSPQTFSPLNTTETPIYENENVVLTWSKVFGFSYYDVEVATDPEFKNIIVSKRVQTPSLVIQELEYGTIYYWRVTVGTWSHEFDMLPKTSEISMFKVGTEEEILENTVIDYASVNLQITELEDLVATIREDYNKDLEKSNSDRIYTGDPTTDLSKLVDSFQERKFAEIKFKKDVDTFLRKIQLEFLAKWGEFVKDHTVHVNDYLADIDNLAIVGKGLVDKVDTGYDIKVSSGLSMVTSKTPVIHRPNTTYKTKMKFETIGPWNCINLMQKGNTAANPTQTASYFVVFKSDCIELQRYPKDASWTNGIVQKFDNNKTVVKDNTWFDVEYSVDYTTEGIHIVFYIDGEKYFDYIDTSNLNCVFDNIGYMANNANGTMSVANSN